MIWFPYFRLFKIESALANIRMQGKEPSNLPCVVIIVFSGATVHRCSAVKVYSKFRKILRKCWQWIPLKNNCKLQVLEGLSATFLLICFVCLKQSTCETREKNLFHFESFFCSWDNQMLTFSVWNTKPILLNNLGSKHSLVGNQIWPVYVIVQNKFFIKKFQEKLGLETSSGLFLIFKKSSKKDSKEGSMLIWTNVDSFGRTYLI